MSTATRDAQHRGSDCQWLAEEAHHASVANLEQRLRAIASRHTGRASASHLGNRDEMRRSFAGVQHQPRMQIRSATRPRASLRAIEPLAVGKAQR